MHSLMLAECDPAEELELIIQSKRGANRTALDGASARIARRYAHFEERFDDASLSTIRAANWSDDEEAALLHCYNAEVAALSDLKALIREAQPLALRSICPYCGIGDPVQFDHYLPKSKFPELAVHAYNLVPCCGPCNGLKAETWLVNGARTFVNFYVDTLPTAAMLETTIRWRTYKGQQVPSISFELQRPARFNAERFELIKTHFHRLDLLNRYSGQAPSELYQFLDSALAHEATGPLRLRRALQRYIDRRTTRLGPLHWKLSLYKVLVDDPTFIAMALA